MLKNKLKIPCGQSLKEGQAFFLKRQNLCRESAFLRLGGKIQSQRLFFANDNGRIISAQDFVYDFFCSQEKIFIAAFGKSFEIFDIFGGMYAGFGGVRLQTDNDGTLGAGVFVVLCNGRRKIFFSCEFDRQI